MSNLPDGTYRSLDDTKPVKKSELKSGDNIIIVSDNGRSTLFTCYRPPRKRTESPVQYYNKHGVVDDHYTRVHNGYYYCNPAHCNHRWTNKAKRDEHLSGAYRMLGG